MQHESCRHGRDDLVDTVVAPASAEAAATAVADVREERERVSKYLARLKEVRYKRSAMEVTHHTLASILSPLCVQRPGDIMLTSFWPNEAFGYTVPDCCSWQCSGLA